MPTTHLNSGNLSDYNFRIGADGMPDLSTFSQNDAFKYTFKHSNGDIYLLRLISDELIWVKLGDRKPTSEPAKSSPGKRTRPTDFKFRRRQGTAADDDTEEVIIKRRKSMPRKKSRSPSPSRRQGPPRESVSDLFEESAKGNVYYVGGPKEELVIESATDLPKPLDTDLPEKEEEEEEVDEVRVGDNDIFKQLIFGLLFGRPTSSSPSPPIRPTPAYYQRDYSPPASDAAFAAQEAALKAQQAAREAELRAQQEAREAELRAQQEAREAELRAQQEREAELRAQQEREAELRAQQEAREAELRVQQEREAELRVQQEREAELRVQQEREAELRAKARGKLSANSADFVPSGNANSVGSFDQPIDKEEAHLANMDKSEEISEIKHKILKAYFPVVVACLATYDGKFTNRTIKRNIDNTLVSNLKNSDEKPLNFTYPLIITGGTAINFHYPDTVDTMDIDLKLVVPSDHYTKLYYKKENATDEEFLADKDVHIIEMNKIANLTRMKLSYELSKCLNSRLKLIQVPDGISNPQIQVKIVNSILENDVTKLVNANIIKDTQKTTYGFIKNAVIITDPKKEGNPKGINMSISPKKMIKIVLEYMYKGTLESIELIDMGMFAREPTLRKNREGESFPTGYRSSFGNLLYDFFLDPKIGIGPDVLAVHPYIVGNYKENKYNIVIPFQKYELKTGPLKGKHITFSNLHSIVQNNLIMTLISYDMCKLDEENNLNKEKLKINNDKIKKYQTRFQQILKKIKNDFKDLRINTIVDEIEKNATIAINDYRNKWINKNYECRYVKSDNILQSFYFTAPLKSKECENYIEELNNSDFTKSMRIVFENIRRLPWNSTNPIIPEPEISQVAKDIGLFGGGNINQDQDPENLYMLEQMKLVNSVPVPDDILAKSRAEGYNRLKNNMIDDVKLDDDDLDDKSTNE
jgi:hypothetical protein